MSTENQEAPLSAEEIEETLENGGPWITLFFEDGSLMQSRRMTVEESEALYVDLGQEIIRAKAKYGMEE